MPRILFITSGLELGGAERHAVTLFNRLGERDHDVHFVFIKDRRALLGQLRPPPSGTVRCLYARRYLDTRAVAELGRTMAALVPDVVVAANEYALLYSMLARPRAAAWPAIVVTIHRMRALGVTEWLKLVASRPLFWAADCAVFVCEAQRRRWRRRALFGRRNEVIYNGIDVEKFTDRSTADVREALRRSLGIEESDYVIALTAGLRPEKNHTQLVDAVWRLRRRGIPARALLIGDGETRAAIEARARRRGVTDHVLITGFKADVRPFISAADVAVLCSLTEAMPLATLEAMALGKPVVHSAVGGAPEIITPGRDGFLFPPRDTSQLVEQLAVLADRASRRAMGRSARAAAVTSFSEQVMVDAYERLLVEVTGERNEQVVTRALP